MTRPTLADHETRIRLQEANEGHTREALGAIVNQLKDLGDHIDARFDKLETRIGEQEKKLAAYENKGAGILIGVGLFGTGVGAAVLAAFAKVMGWFE